VLLDNFSINGAIPITYTQVQDMMSTIEQRSHDREQRLLDTIMRNNSNNSAYSTVTHSNSNNANSNNAHTWAWGGRFHSVPEDFHFPKTDCRKLWDLWWDGNPVKEYGPYRNLCPYDLSCAANHQILSRARYVMNKLIESSGLEKRGIIQLPISSRDDCFENSFISLYRSINPDLEITSIDKRRIGDLSFITLYDQIKKALKHQA